MSKPIIKNRTVSDAKGPKVSTTSKPASSGNLGLLLRKTQSHFLVSPEKLDKATRRVIAPYAQIVRKGVKEERKEGTYLDINRFNVFLEDTVDLDSLLYETAMVLKTVTNSSGAFVYMVNEVNNELIMMPKNTKNPARHEVNIPIDMEDNVSDKWLLTFTGHFLPIFN